MKFVKVKSKQDYNNLVNIFLKEVNAIENDQGRSDKCKDWYTKMITAKYDVQRSRP